MNKLLLTLILLTTIILLSGIFREWLLKLLGWDDLSLHERARANEEKRLIEDAAQRAADEVEAANKAAKEKHDALTSGVDPADTINRLTGARPK